MLFLERMCVMSTPKFKHLSFEDRCFIQEFLNYNYNFTQISNRLGKSRRTISNEVFKHRFMLNICSTDASLCPSTLKPPYVCNGCPNKQACKKVRYSYDASIAHNEYSSTLSNTRSTLHLTKNQISAINDIISPLMILKHHSVNHVYISHPELFPFSKSTFYRYIDSGILNVRNIDLQRKVRFKIKNELDNTRPKTNTKIKIGRFYRDFQEYLEFHPLASIVEMDTVIGTSGGKGGVNVFLLFYFVNTTLC